MAERPEGARLQAPDEDALRAIAAASLVERRAVEIAAAITPEPAKALAAAAGAS